jgi:DNA replication protein DnaC
VESAPCAACGGAGYLVEQRLGQTARAKRCQCQAACPRCGESGYVLVPGPGGSKAQVCACRHLDERISTFNRIGIPAAVAQASFEGFRIWSPDHAAGKAAAEDFARKFRSEAPSKGFLFYGRPGGGKTHLLAATLRWLALEKGVPCRYVEFMLLLSDIKAGFDSGRNQMEILRPLVSVPVLAIDELGKERGTDWERSMLDELISRRFNGGLATLFATNYFLDPKAPSEEPGRPVRTRTTEFAREAEAMSLSQRVGDRIYSRLNEMCAFVRLDPGMDKRKDGAGGFWGR